MYFLRYPMMGSPPLARGVQWHHNCHGNDQRITPACAGSTFRKSSRVPQHWDHPRLRGEYGVTGWNKLPYLGSPPLARGVHTVILAGVAVEGITPACAGSTSTMRHHRPTYQDHPRLRGEYELTVETDLLVLGSPPLARGVQRYVLPAVVSKGITPACAGSTIFQGHDDQLVLDHPRLRGEYKWEI